MAAQAANPKARAKRQSKEETEAAKAEKEAVKAAKAAAKAEARRQKDLEKAARVVAKAKAKRAAQAQKEARVAAKARAKALVGRAKTVAKAAAKAAGAGEAAPASRRRGPPADKDGDGVGSAAAPKRPRRGEAPEGDGGEDEEALPEDAAVRAEELLGGRSAAARDRAGCVARVAELERHRVAAAVRLLEEGNTVPFIARYRKELTGCLAEDQLRKIERGLRRVDALESRRVRVALALHKRGMLSEELRAALLQAAVLEEVEDLWAPFKAKKQTRAQLARQRGLGPLAKLIELCGGNAVGQSPEAAAARFADAATGVPGAKEALAGARDILAEKYAQGGDAKQRARSLLEPRACLSSRQRPGADAEGRYKTYWSFGAPLKLVRPYQFLAIQRGEAVGALHVGFEAAAEAGGDFVEALVWQVARGTGGRGRAWEEQQQRGAWEQELRVAAADAFKRLLRPSLEREWRRRLKELAEDDAFDTYRRNVHSKLLTQPLRLHPDFGEVSEDGPVIAVLGVDPAYRTGCKLALIAGTGQVLATQVVYPHPSHSAGEVPWQQAKQAAELLQDIMEIGLGQAAGHGAGRLLCSIGNGTASRETEAWIRQHIKGSEALVGRVAYCVVDEAGASVYSASPLAGRELPDMDVSMRGAVSIARRLLDPMAELVKVDPQSLGVGLYQHDVDQRRLAGELKAAVMDCVNAVGVDLNTASPSLLEHVAGLSAALARTVVEYRAEHGPFASRAALLEVRGVGRRSHHQAAGFLRVHGGIEPLDATAVHPESYEVARRLRVAGVPTGRGDLKRLAAAWGVGEQTMADIAAVVAGTAAADPREAQPPPHVKAPGAGGGGRRSVGPVDAQEAGLTVNDLAIGAHLQGVVRNVVAFGAFVDIGVGSDGLLHVSQYPAAARGRAEALSVNERVEVWVQALERQAAGPSGGRAGGRGRGGRGSSGKEKWRIALSARPPG